MLKGPIWRRLASLFVPRRRSFWLMPAFMLKKIVLGNFAKGPVDSKMADAIDFMVDRVSAAFCSSTKLKCWIAANKKKKKKWSVTEGTVVCWLQLESLNQSELASRLTLNCQNSYVEPHKIKDVAVTIIDVSVERTHTAAGERVCVCVHSRRPLGTTLSPFPRSFQRTVFSYLLIIYYMIVKENTYFSWMISHSLISITSQKEEKKFSHWRASSDCRFSIRVRCRWRPRRTCTNSIPTLGELTWKLEGISPTCAGALRSTSTFR